MKTRLFLTATILLGMMGCKTIYIPVKETEYVTVKDSVYFRDTTIQYQVEKEYVRDYTGMLDTLQMETSYASARAWVDTSRAVLAGSIKNKDKVIDIQAAVKEKVVYKDSIHTNEVPVPVEVIKTVHPKYEGWLWGWLIFSLLALSFWLYTKFHR